MLSLHGRALRITMFAALMATAFSGCMTGPRWMRYKKVDPNSQYQPGSDAWWAEKAQLPVGTRQRVHKGKVYPPFPRPTGEKQQYSHKFHAAHYWPLPYVCQDREIVENVWNDQVANGWTEATTLYDYHFQEDGYELNQPGRRQLRWIMEHAPANRRIAFVQSSYDTVADDARISAVRASAEEYAGAGTVPNVLVRHTTPAGRPAVELERIRENQIGSLLQPRITAPIGAGGSGGGGSTSP